MNKFTLLSFLTATAVFGAIMYMEQSQHNTSFLKWEPSPSALYDSWNDWKEKMGKTYGSDEE